MEYQLLPVDDAPVLAKSKPSRVCFDNDTLSWVAIAVCILCTIINVLVTFWSNSTFQRYTFPSAASFVTSRGLTRRDIDSLRRPSQFIGLDKIPRNITNKTEAESFVNFPLLMAQIDSSKPYEVTQPRKGEQTAIGVVYPELADMNVTSSISTIVQFRALDYGMERCEISINIPAEEPMRPLVLPSSIIQIYAIPHKQRLYSDTLFYAKRPQRGELIGEPRLYRNSTWSHSFRCLMDEIYTFEVACKDGEVDNCALRWTQDKEHDSFPAILMTQFST